MRADVARMQAYLSEWKREIDAGEHVKSRAL